MLRLLETINHKRNDKKVFVTAVVGSGLIGGAISLWIGLRQSVWFDEAYSILVAKQPVGELVHLVGLDTHPPLYYILLKTWAGLFGWTEISLRSMSAIALVLAIIVAGLLVRKLFGARIAIGTVLLLMIAPLILRYGFEIRMYSLGMLIGVAATYALVVANERARGYRKWLVAYGLLVVIGMYTMYSLALLWIAHVAWILYLQKKHKYSMKRLGEWAGAYIGAAILFIPWLPTFLQQATNDALAPIGQLMNAEQILGITSFNILYKPLFQVDAVATILLLASLAMIGWSVAQAFQHLHRQRDGLVLLVMYIGVPVVLLVLVSIVKAMYVERYLSHVALGGLMLCGVALISTLIHRRTKKTTYLISAVYMTILIGCFQLMSVGNFNFQRMQTPTIQQASQTLQYCSSDTTVLAADPYVATELSYFSKDCPVHFFSQSDTLRGGYAPLSGSQQQVKDMSQLSDTHVSYVYYGMPDEKLSYPYQKQSEKSYGALTIARYARTTK